MVYKQDLAILSTALSSLVSGLFAGAMLLIALAIVPYWQSLDPQVFHNWFLLHAHHLGDAMVPLLMASVSLSAVTFALAFRLKRKSRLLSAGAFFSLMAILVIYMIANRPVNSVLLNGESLSAITIRNSLAAWRFWHWVRVLFGVVSFGFSIATLTSLSVETELKR